MPETARSKPLEIWFQDEARVGQQGTLTRIWAERGTRPRAPRDTRYIWSYIFGAVCPERAEAAALIMPHADTQAMSAHLAEIAKTVASGAHALLILDGAGWHGSAELEVPDNITLLKLPPYSPELNPMENVWAYLRANKLAISVFDNYEQIVDRCCEAWNFFANDKTAITSTDIPHIPSKFMEFVPLSHRQGNCIPYAAIRWHDFGNRPALGRPLGHFSRHPDTPLLSLSPRRRFPRPTPERVFVADHQSSSGFSGTGPSAPPPQPIGT